MNNSYVYSTFGFYGAFLYFEINDIITNNNDQIVIIEYSYFYNNIAVFGGIMLFSKNLVDMQAIIRYNDFISNFADCIIL